MCKTCIKIRKAAFAVIRTIVAPVEHKDKQNQEDAGDDEKSKDESS